MNNALRHNLAVIRQGVKLASPVIEQRYVMSIFTLVANKIFSWIDSHPAYYKDQTFNLRDSIGVGVYKNGAIVQWIHNPAPKATRKKKFKERGVDYASFGVGEHDYWQLLSGRELLNNAISNAEYAKFADYTLAVFATAPWGLLVEDGKGKRGTGWWTEGLVPYVKERFAFEIAKHMKR